MRLPGTGLLVGSTAAWLFSSTSSSFEEEFDRITDNGSSWIVDNTWRSSRSARTATCGCPIVIAAHVASSHIHDGNSRQTPARTST
jgi:hypothetical protein